MWEAAGAAFDRPECARRDAAFEAIRPLECAPPFSLGKKMRRARWKRNDFILIKGACVYNRYGSSAQSKESLCLTDLVPAFYRRCLREATHAPSCGADLRGRVIPAPTWFPHHLVGADIIRPRKRSALIDGGSSGGPGRPLLPLRGNSPSPALRKMQGSSSRSRLRQQGCDTSMKV